MRTARSANLCRVALGMTLTALALVSCASDESTNNAQRPDPTTTTTTAVPSVDAVLRASAPEGYRVEDANPEVERETRERFEQDPEAQEIVDEVHMRTITKGGVPVATVILLDLSGGTSSADRAGIARGYAEGAGAGEPVNLGSLDGTLFTEDGVTTVITTTTHYGLFVIGEDRAEVEAVAKGASTALTA